MIDEFAACSVPVWPKFLTSGPAYLRSTFSRGEGTVESDSREVPGLEKHLQSATICKP